MVKLVKMFVELNDCHLENMQSFMLYLEELTAATLPPAVTAPTVRLDCLNAFLNILELIIQSHRKRRNWS